MSTLSHNTEAFLALLRAGLWKEVKEEDLQGKDSPLAFSSVDWSEVYQLAEEQSVIGLVAAGVEKVQEVQGVNVPREWAFQFIGQTLQIEQRNKAMNEFVSSLVEKLRAAEVFTLLVKGQGISQCYERPLWRASGDVDLLLSEDNYEKAKSILLPLASSYDVEEKHAKHIGLTLDGWSVELHGTQHSELSNRIDRVIDEVQNDVFCGGSVRSWDNSGTTVLLPAPDNDVIFIFTHFIKHYFKEGVGLRQVCDWCRLLYTYKDSLNQILLEQRIRKARLMSEWKAFAALAVDYLGMPIEAMPLYSTEAKWKRKAKAICDYILEVGNFGHNRDMSYLGKYPYVIHKCISFWRRTGYLLRHASVFPWDSVRFFPSLVFNGVRSALRGE